MKVINKTTGEIFDASYEITPSGKHKRFWVEGKFYTDKKFDATFTIIRPEDIRQMTFRELWNQASAGRAIYSPFESMLIPENWFERYEEKNAQKVYRVYQFGKAFHVIGEAL